MRRATLKEVCDLINANEVKAYIEDVTGELKRVKLVTFSWEVVYFVSERDSFWTQRFYCTPDTIVWVEEVEK